MFLLVLILVPSSFQCNFNAFCLFNTNSCPGLKLELNNSCWEATDIMKYFDKQTTGPYQDQKNGTRTMTKSSGPKVFRIGVQSSRPEMDRTKTGPGPGPETSPSPHPATGPGPVKGPGFGLETFSAQCDTEAVAGHAYRYDKNTINHNFLQG